MPHQPPLCPVMQYLGGVIGYRAGLCQIGPGSARVARPAFPVGQGGPALLGGDARSIGGDMRFSANLGFLWTELSLDQAIHAAADAGFAAVECHWPYTNPPEVIARALHQTNLPMLALNTRPGDVAAGEFGLAALPGRMPDAQAAIREALAYARAIGAQAVHVMSGKAQGPEARKVFAENLRFALAEAGDLTLLIEPINAHDVPGYFLSDLDTALGLIDEIGAPNLRLMADCYHLARMGHDVARVLAEVLPVTGHIQFADHPGRGAPGTGALDLDAVFTLLGTLGWTAPIGAEYRPNGSTGASLGWMDHWRG